MIAWLRYGTIFQASRQGTSGKGSAFPALSPVTRRLYTVCLAFLKLFEQIYAPLTAGLPSPVSTESQQKRCPLDRLYSSTNSWPPSVSKPPQPTRNENKILVTLRIAV